MGSYASLSLEDVAKLSFVELCAVLREYHKPRLKLNTVVEMEMLKKIKASLEPDSQNLITLNELTGIPVSMISERLLADARLTPKARKMVLEREVAGSTAYMISMQPPEEQDKWADETASLPPNCRAVFP